MDERSAQEEPEYVAVRRRAHEALTALQDASTKDPDRDQAIDIRSFFGESEITVNDIVLTPRQAPHRIMEGFRLQHDPALALTIHDELTQRGFVPAIETTGSCRLDEGHYDLLRRDGYVDYHGNRSCGTDQEIIYIREATKDSPRLKLTIMYYGGPSIYHWSGPTYPAGCVLYTQSEKSEDGGKHWGKADRITTSIPFDQIGPAADVLLRDYVDRAPTWKEFRERMAPMEGILPGERLAVYNRFHTAGERPVQEQQRGFWAGIRGLLGGKKK